MSEQAKDIAGELAEATRKAEERAKARRALQQKFELEALRLEEKFEAEKGPRGTMFEIVETVVGPIVVELGEGILFQRFSKSKMTETDVHNFVFPCVLPAFPQFMLS